MNSYKNIDRTAMVLITLVCFIWGLQQVFVKAVSTDMPPVLQMALRFGIASVLLIAVMIWRRERLFCRHTLKAGLLTGVLFASEFFFVGEGLRYTTASHMVIFLYSAPIFVALILHFRLASERLSPIQWVGILSAFSGIALSFLWREAEVDTADNMILGDFLAILAALSWAVTTVLVRSSSLAKASAMQTLSYQLVIGFIIILIGAFTTDQTEFTATTAAISNLIFQGTVVSFGSLLLWFWLLRQYSASELGVFTFLTPVFGVALGVLILDEPVELSFIIGALLVVLGITLVSSHHKIVRRVKLALQ